MVGIINGKCDKNIDECIKEFERISERVWHWITNNINKFIINKLLYIGILIIFYYNVLYEPFNSIYVIVIIIILLFCYYYYYICYYIVFSIILYIQKNALFLNQKNVKLLHWKRIFLSFQPLEIYSIL